MFLNSTILNEGTSREQLEEGRKRELQEGKNPRATSAGWKDKDRHSHSSVRWQKLRK